MINDFENLENTLKNYISVFKNEIKTISTCNFEKKFLEDVEIIASDKKVHKIKDLCKIETDNDNNIILLPFNKSDISFIEKKLNNLFGLSIIVSKFNIKIKKSLINFEKRKEIEKLIKKKMELFKVFIRNKRNLEIKKIDNNYKNKKIIQEIINSYNKELENICNNKIKNI